MIKIYDIELNFTDNPKDFFSADQKEMVVNFFFTYLSNSNCCILFLITIVYVLENTIANANETNENNIIDRYWEAGILGVAHLGFCTSQKLVQSRFSVVCTKFVIPRLHRN